MDQGKLEVVKLEMAKENINILDFQKSIYFCFIDYAKAFDCGSQETVGNSERDGHTRPPDMPLEKSVCRSGRKLLDLDMEQQTGSKYKKEYVKAGYCQPAYLTSMQSTS